MGGLSILETGALAALSSLLVPLLIHLFNRSRGKIVWIGHVDLVKKAKKIRVTEIKITQWLLLTIRLLILFLLALFLAKLVYEQTSPVKPRVNLVSPNWILNSTESEFDQKVRHDASGNYFLSAEVKPIPESWPEAQQAANDLLKAEPFNFQALLLAWEANAIAAKEFHVFALNDSSLFGNVSVELLNQYDFHFKSLSTVNNATVLPKKVKVVFDSDRSVDQQVLANAFEFLNGFGQVKYQVNYQTLDNLNNLDQAIDADVVLYLTDDILHRRIEEFITGGGLLISDANSKKSENGLKLINPNNNLIRIFKSNPESTASDSLPTGKTLSSKRPSSKIATSKTPSTTETLWHDKRGSALLVSKQTNHIQWLSRFHPQWTDWVLQPSFPRDFSHLLSIGLEQTATPVEPNGLPFKQPTEEENKEPTKNTPLEQWLILLVCFLWVIERWLAEKRFITAPSKGASNE